MLRQGNIVSPKMLLLLTVAIIAGSVGTMEYARQVRDANAVIEQERMLVQKAAKNVEKAEFFVVFSDDGKVVAGHSLPHGKNVYSTPDMAALFQKCASRAMRDGGFVTFSWPSPGGTVCPHIGYAYVDEKQRIAVMGEPQK